MSVGSDLLWGIDLGGTKIEGVVLKRSNITEPAARLRIPTEQARGYEHIKQQVAELIRQLSEKTGVSPRAIGIGHPGCTEPATGQIKNSNTAALNGMPLISDLRPALGCEIHSANDANCFALAEAHFGAGRGAETVFGVILGTGVGGGIVVSGKVLNGAQGIAGEWGHNPICLEPGDEPPPECYCGRRGCVESVISGPALEQFYYGRSGLQVELKTLVDKRAVDPSAAETSARLIRNFGKAISNVINILDPHCIVLGGGVSNIDLLYTEGIDCVRKNVFNSRLGTKIVKNSLGDSAGVFGAAMLCEEAR